MMMVENVFGEYVPMNEEDVEELLKENKKLIEENAKLKSAKSHMLGILKRCTSIYDND